MGPVSHADTGYKRSSNVHPHWFYNPPNNLDLRYMGCLSNR